MQSLSDSRTLYTILILCDTVTASSSQYTLGQAAEPFLALSLDDTSYRHREQLQRMLSTYALPALGHNAAGGKRASAKLVLRVELGSARLAKHV